MSKNESKHWNLHPIDYSAVQNLASDLRLNTLLTTVLVNRGARTVWEARHFLEPRLEDILDPHLMLNMGEAVDRCTRAVLNNEHIVIFGDNDVDGVTSTTLVYQFLSLLNADVRYFLPRRKEDGHGFNTETIAAALQAATPSLFIAVDCAMTGVEEIKELKRRGIDTIIVDHHAPGAVLPDAVILNPKLENNPFPFKDLAAVGVAYHFIEALDAHFKTDGIYESLGVQAPNLVDYLDLVCLGTIADVMPLVNENRCFVSLGLDVIRKRRRSGIAALLSDLSVDDSAITEKTICFRLAPRINAAGRMGDPNECVALLSAYRFTTAQAIAKNLENYNLQRQNAEAAISSEAIEDAQTQVNEGKRVIIIIKDNWPQGLLGIISSRLLDKFYRPSIVIAVEGDKCRGSARSTENFNILNCFKHCAELLDDFGGHHAAAGLNIQLKNLDAFIQMVHSYAENEMQGNTMVLRNLDIDAEISIADLLNHWENQYLEWLAPFGSSNKEPTFLLSQVKILQIKPLNRSSVRIRIKQGNDVLNLIAALTLVEGLKVGDSINAVITPKYAPHKQYPEYNLLAVRK